MKEILSKGAVFKKKMLLSLLLLFTLYKLFVLPMGMLCMSGIILPVSGRFEVKEHEFVCECLTADSISRLLGEKFNMNSESNDEESRTVA